jgi:hypothetical protein
MNRQKEGWEQFLEEGRSFHRAALGGLKRPEVFTPEIIQNIAAMGIEKYFMALFVRQGVLPRNHTMEDFIEEARAFMLLPEDLEVLLRRFDALQNICSFDDFRITKPSLDDVNHFVDAVNRVAVLAEKACGA